jgi:hypothetical protein
MLDISSETRSGVGMAYQDDLQPFMLLEQAELPNQGPLLTSGSVEKDGSIPLLKALYFRIIQT